MFLNLYNDIRTASFTASSSATDLSDAILELHLALKDKQNCACILYYSTSEAHIVGYRRNNSRGRYIALVRTNTNAIVYRVYDSAAEGHVIADVDTTPSVKLDTGVSKVTFQMYNGKHELILYDDNGGHLTFRFPTTDGTIQVI